MFFEDEEKESETVTNRRYRISDSDK